MKKIVKQVAGFLIFVLILAVIYCSLTWLFRGNGSEAREEICVFKNQGPVDVVLYGASNLLRYYEPLAAWEEKGFTSYNYATLSGPADTLKDYIAESRGTNEALLYVCDVRAFTMVTDRVEESALRNWSDSLPPFSPARWKGITSYLFSRDRTDVDVESYYFDLMKYHTNYEALSDEEQWKYLDLKSIYNVDKGFEPNEDHIPFEKPEICEHRAELSERQSAVLEELLDYCDNENLQTLFICNPIILKEADCEVLNTIGDRIEERGYPFVNFNRYYDEMGLDFETDFGDVNHVNYLGARKYTDYLAEYISSHYDLPDHRDDPAYEQWNTDCETYAAYRKEWEDHIVSLVDGHFESRDNAYALRESYDFSTWFSGINSPDYSVLVLMTDLPGRLSAANPFREMVEKYGIDPEAGALAGAWSGEEMLGLSYDEEMVELNVGVDGGRGSWKCRISIPDQIIRIGADNYFVPGEKNQIVIYDNNYKKAIDRVYVDLTEDSISIRRQ